MGPYGHALYKHYNNDIISAFLIMDAGGGPETVLPLGVALSESVSVYDWLKNGFVTHEVNAEVAYTR